MAALLRMFGDGFAALSRLPKPVLPAPADSSDSEVRAGEGQRLEQDTVATVAMGVSSLRRFPCTVSSMARTGGADMGLP